VRAGLTTSQTTQSQQLSELLNSLESAVENLNYKSFTVYDTLNTAIEAVRAALLPTQTDEVGTDVLE
jgi:negative regulator of sigma E activity